MSQRSRIAGALIAVAALASGCASANSGSSSDEGVAEQGTVSTSAPRAESTATTEPATTTTTVVLPPVEPIGWSRCGRFDCGRVQVPVDYSDPGGSSLELALIRRPASDPSQRIGTLVMNPGGPGASGVRRVQRGFTVNSDVADRFDIVGFDPRGIGASTPITCGAAVSAFRATDLAPDGEGEHLAMVEAARAVAEECAASEGDRLAHLGTADVVHDLEMIRRALGEEQISYVGLSYGTLIGLLWADAYPGSVRAMALDGVSNPAEGGGVASVSQARAVDATFAAMAAACAKDDGCPLSAHGGHFAAYDRLATAVEAGAGAGEGVGPTQLSYAAFYATYGDELWPDFWEAVADGLGGDLTAVADLSASFTGLVAYAPFAIVSCLDSEHPMGEQAWSQDAKRMTRASPRFGSVLANELLPCAFWPQSRREPRAVSATGAGPILLVGSTGDVATPYKQAEQVARDLDSGVLLTAELDGHVALGASDCVTDEVARYLIHATPPAEGTRC